MLFTFENSAVVDSDVFSVTYILQHNNVRGNDRAASLPPRRGLTVKPQLPINVAEWP